MDQSKQPAPSVTGLFLEEQEWVPGYKAPVLYWLTMLGAVGFLATGVYWLHKHNEGR